MPEKKVIYFATSNTGKILSLNNFAKELALPLEIRVLKASHPEVKRDNTLRTIALDKAVWLSEKFNKPVFSTDVGIFIRALKGFPGVNTAFSIDRIGVAGISRLIEGKRDRKVSWECALAYKEPGKKPLSFSASLRGEIPEKPRGKKGFGWDPIFVPRGFNETFGERPDLRDSLSPLRACLKKLAREIC